MIFRSVNHLTISQPSKQLSASIIKDSVVVFIFGQALYFQHISRNNFSQMRLKYVDFSLGGILFQTSKQHSYCCLPLRKKCPYLELFSSVFSRIQSECGKIRTRISSNTDTFYPVWKYESIIAKKFNGKSLKIKGRSPIWAMKNKEQCFQLFFDRNCTLATSRRLLLFLAFLKIFLLRKFNFL